MSAPPRHGSAGMTISKGIAESASSCLALHRPLRAVLNTSAMATPRSDEAA